MGYFGPGFTGAMEGMRENNERRTRRRSQNLADYTNYLKTMRAMGQDLSEEGVQDFTQTLTNGNNWLSNGLPTHSEMRGTVENHNTLLAQERTRKRIADEKMFDEHFGDMALNIGDYEAFQQNVKQQYGDDVAKRYTPDKFQTLYDNKAEAMAEQLSKQQRFTALNDPKEIDTVFSNIPEAVRKKLKGYKAAQMDDEFMADVAKVQDRILNSGQEFQTQMLFGDPSSFSATIRAMASPRFRHRLGEYEGQIKAMLDGNRVALQRQYQVQKYQELYDGLKADGVLPELLAIRSDAEPMIFKMVQGYAKRNNIEVFESQDDPAWKDFLAGFRGQAVSKMRTENKVLSLKARAQAAELLEQNNNMAANSIQTAISSLKGDDTKNEYARKLVGAMAARGYALPSDSRSTDMMAREVLKIVNEGGAEPAVEAYLSSLGVPSKVAAIERTTAQLMGTNGAVSYGNTVEDVVKPEIEAFESQFKMLQAGRSSLYKDKDKEGWKDALNALVVRVENTRDEVEKLAYNQQLMIPGYQENAGLIKQRFDALIARLKNEQAYAKWGTPPPEPDNASKYKSRPDDEVNEHMWMR